MVGQPSQPQIHRVLIELIEGLSPLGMVLNELPVPGLKIKPLSLMAMFLLIFMRCSGGFCALDGLL